MGITLSQAGPGGIPFLAGDDAETAMLDGDSSITTLLISRTDWQPQASRTDLAGSPRSARSVPAARTQAARDADPRVGTKMREMPWGGPPP